MGLSLVPRLCRLSPAFDTRSHAGKRARLVHLPAIAGALEPRAVHRLLQSNGPTSTTSHSPNPSFSGMPTSSKPSTLSSPASEETAPAGFHCLGVIPPLSRRHHPRLGTRANADFPQAARSRHLLSLTDSTSVPEKDQSGDRTDSRPLRRLLAKPLEAQIAKPAMPEEHCPEEHCPEEHDLLLGSPSSAPRENGSGRPHPRCLPPQDLFVGRLLRFRRCQPEPLTRFPSSMASK